MYFAKARKQMDEQDMREVQEKLEKYQRSDSARVQLQQLKISRAAAEDGSSGSRRSSRGDFRPDELPDGAFVSPKHTPSQVSPAKIEPVTVSRSAEYIGSFSVTGADEEARTRQVETQLESLRSVTKSKKVMLVISLDGIKVCSEDGQSVYMFHELKRISYATCDPDHCQFSFLARERQMNVLYCHTFITQTPDQAEELNLIIGNAFKMAYAQQRDKQPTFHELIEAQVAEQQAKFREIEKQAQVELQRKLADIARPTPFSQHAIQRMEQRRQASEDFLLDADLIVGRNKVWAKHSADHAQHRISLHEAYFSELPSAATGTTTGPRLSDPSPVVPAALRRRDESEPPPFSSNAKGGRSGTHKNITKHNSAPLFPAQVPSPSDDPPSLGEQVSCVIPHHPLSAQAIRVSLETKKDSKFKGSPVTALKNEIDKRFLSNGAETSPLEGIGSVVALQALERETDQKALRQELVRQQIHMASRPLPSVPQGASPTSNRNSNSSSSSSSNANTRVSPSPRQRQRPSSTYQFRSYDDHHHLPSSSSSPSPLSAAHKNPSPSSSSPNSNGVAIRNSPRRKQARPLSEITTGSSGMIVGGPASRGYDNWHPMGLYETGPATAVAAVSSSSSSSSAVASSSSGLGPSPSQSPRHSSKTSTPPILSSSSSPKVESGVYIYGPTPGGVMAELRAGGKGPRFESSQQQEGSSSCSGSGCPSGNAEPVMRYQNDSPFNMEDQETAGRMRQGLESLMCLDRSHIEDPALRQASWYQAGIPREIALEILQQEEVGSFIVRDSTTHPGCFALSVRVPKFENSAGISHYLILKTQRGVKLKGLDKEWPTLTALVTHHTVMPEMLPCTLRLPRNNKNLTFRHADRDDPQDDQPAAPYHRLSDVTAMASQLKL